MTVVGLNAEIHFCVCNMSISTALLCAQYVNPVSRHILSILLCGLNRVTLSGAALYDSHIHQTRTDSTQKYNISAESIETLLKD